MDANHHILSRTLTMILAGGEGTRLYPLTRVRPKPTVGFGGICRIIDFALSNCLNSGLKHAYVLTQHMSETLGRHLRSGWSHFGDSPRLGISLLPAGSRQYVGTADAVFKNLHLLEQDNCEFVLILAGDHIYQMDYNELVRSHVESGAEATIATIEYPLARSRQFGIVQADRQGRIVGFEEKPDSSKPLPTDPTKVLANAGIYVFNASLLEKALTADSRRATSHDFGRDVLPDVIHSHRSYIYNFKDTANEKAGYWRDIGTLDAYYEASMDLLDADSGLNLFDADWPIRSSLPPSPSSKSEAKSRHSIISPGVRVDSSAEVEDSILLPGVHVGPGARLRRAIVDENVYVPAGAEIGWDLGNDRRRFAVSDGGVVAISGDSLINGADGPSIHRHLTDALQRAASVA